uniref:Uncharacterized protein n=1 Tax=Anguilla anguilla TaxID=7936 RepID=A0A0E9S2C4_ANGAN
MSKPRGETRHNIARLKLIYSWYKIFKPPVSRYLISATTQK